MPQSMLRLGTRGSRLALVQAVLVRDALAAHDFACEIVPLRTTGDRIQDRPLAAVGGKGLFTKELEEALLDGRIDLAVHSMKDVPVLLPDALDIVAVLPRDDVRDVFISPLAASLEDLPAGARVGTSSVRRQAQVARARPDLQLVPLRGNVDTRLAKLDRGEIDAVLLAYAGLKRLGLEARATRILPVEEWLPALSQGALGIEMRRDHSALALVSALNHAKTAVVLACERAFQKALDGSCVTSIAGLAQFDGQTLRFRGEVLAPDGSGFADTVFATAVTANPVEDAERLGNEAGLELKPRALPWLPG
ncbi:MAG: hydroxymethylbilane synthase [Alphaproteobacteria bacterium]|nr:hydroxymethylbilane synthase [Alphaproteobacteria bacterium]